MGVVIIKNIKTALIAGLVAVVILPDKNVDVKVEDQSMFFLHGSVVSQEKSDLELGGISILDKSDDEVEFEFKLFEVIRKFFDF